MELMKEYKRRMRESRGRLTKHDLDLETIFKYGTPQLIDFSLTKKLMGVSNIAWIALQSGEYQKKFTDYILEKNWKATKNELDLWFSYNKHLSVEVDEVAYRQGKLF